MTKLSMLQDASRSPEPDQAKSLTSPARAAHKLACPPSLGPLHFFFLFSCHALMALQDEVGPPRLLGCSGLAKVGAQRFCGAGATGWLWMLLRDGGGAADRTRALPPEDNVLVVAAGGYSVVVRSPAHAIDTAYTPPTHTYPTHTNTAAVKERVGLFRTTALTSVVGKDGKRCSSGWAMGCAAAQRLHVPQLHSAIWPQPQNTRRV
jgi:hypothetical protein